MGTSKLYSSNLLIYNLFVCSFVLKNNIMEEKAGRMQDMKEEEIRGME